MPEPILAEGAAPGDSVTQPPLPEAVDRILTGWGRTSPTAARVITPGEPADVVRSLWSHNGATRPGVIARGLGRSYGDAAQCAGGLVIETGRLDRIGAINDAGEVEVDAGVSLAALLRTRARAVLCTDPLVTGDPDLLPLRTVLDAADVLVIAAPHSHYRDLRTAKPVIDIWNVLGHGVLA